ncbi:nose resistant to fluoxetine protein 6-like [Diabrotica undecimpunctata]|uniref:nose resistant to fluoxetine protein 6-like n=1 Tax=Diabrotica undecimpunctata TaxID=50387 RepID=UPI003B6340FF
MLFQIVILIVSSNIFVSCRITDGEYALMPTLFHLDDYDECMLLKKKALYCTFRFELQSLSTDNVSDIWIVLKNVSSDPRNYRHDHLRHGICVPKTCNNITGSKNLTKLQENIETCYNNKYKESGLKGFVHNLNCNTNVSKYQYDFYDILIGVIFISYTLLIILSSFYEGIARYQKKAIYEKIFSSTGGKIIAAFSIPKNWHRLKAPNKNEDAEKLRSINGIRFYTMICVILAHTIMVTFAGPVANPQYTEQLTDNTLNMFLANGNYAVQTFFLISGWLLSYHFFDMMKDHKVFHLKNVLLGIINRYIRLTPTLIAVIALQSTWLIYVGQGPSWDNIVGEEYKNCRQNWWTNILYINNYVNKNNMCLIQTWYIAADTQLYIFSLILLTFVWKYESKVKYILGITIAIGLLIPGLIAFFKNHEIIIRQYPEILYDMKGVKQAAWHDLYSSGYSNITGYTIGLTFGYIFYKYKDKVVNVNKFHIVLWWIFTLGTCNFVVLIATQMYSPSYKSSAIASAFYWALGKNVFALGIAVTIYGFTRKVGWFARWICEWKAISVMGRLTYSTYIAHSSVIRVRGGLIRSPLFVNDYLLLMTALGDITLSYLVGTVVCLMFEMPISALQKLILPK